MENKQKFFIIGGIVLLVILMLICFGMGEDNSETDLRQSEDSGQILATAQSESKAVKEEEKKEFEQINIDRYIEIYSSENYQLVLIARPTCGYCQIAEPIIQNVAYNYNIDIKYLNTDNFEGDDIAKLRNSNEYFKDGFGTPLLLIIGNNEIKDMINGVTDSAHYINFLKVYGFIR